MGAWGMAASSGLNHQSHIQWPNPAGHFPAASSQPDSSFAAGSSRAMQEMVFVAFCLQRVGRRTSKHGREMREHLHGKAIR